jgi:hypothetical protein
MEEGVLPMIPLPIIPLTFHLPTAFFCGRLISERKGLCPQITGPMHADGEKENSGFFICVHLRHLRATLDSVAAGRAAPSVIQFPAWGGPRRPACPPAMGRTGCASG